MISIRKTDFIDLVYVRRMSYFQTVYYIYPLLQNYILAL